MAHVDIEKKIKDILFERGMVLTYKEVEPSSQEDMYEVTFYLNGEIYKIVPSVRSISPYVKPPYPPIRSLLLPP